jgi:arylformamidase
MDARRPPKNIKEGSKMRKLVFIGGMISIAATACNAQRGERLSKECRQEVVKLCGMDRGKMRECLKDKNQQLSEPCYDEVVARIREKRAGAERKAQPEMEKQMAALGAIEHSYGNGPLQKLDFYKPEGRVNNAPLIVFVHGGGWSKGDKRNATGAAKIKHFRAAGYAFASINYPLVPQATVEQQAGDVANAIAYLRGKASTLGIDPNRIVLMGHSAGAHLAALVGTDPFYLQKAGLRLSDVRGVVPIDGACYDVPAQMTDGARIMHDTYEAAFGTDVARQKALSPTLHAMGPNAPSFLLLHADRDDGKRQTEALAGALRKAGTQVQLNGFEGKGLQGHMDINRKLGEADYPATAVVDAWLKGVFGR